MINCKVEKIIRLIIYNIIDNFINKLIMKNQFVVNLVILVSKEYHENSSFMRISTNMRLFSLYRLFIIWNYWDNGVIFFLFDKNIIKRYNYERWHKVEHHAIDTKNIDLMKSHTGTNILFSVFIKNIILFNKLSNIK